MKKKDSKYARFILNAGYNPQTLADYGIKVVEEKSTQLVTEDVDGVRQIWEKTKAKDQHSLIKQHPKTVSLEHNGQFYIERE